MTEEINSLKQLFKDINEIKMLSADEEKELCKKVADGDEEAKKELVNRNLRLIISVAKHYQNCGLPLQDLIQEGTIGLMKAADKFDISKGYKFSTFASWWIRQTIGRAIAEQSRIIRVPVHITEIINKVKKAERELYIELGRIPENEEIAKKASLNLKDVQDARKYYNDVSSLDIPIGEDESDTIGDFIEDTKFINPETQYIKQSNKETDRDAIEKVLSTLSQREQNILKLRFGLKDGKPRTLEQVGHEYNLTKERIRQIELKALAKLRAPARAAYLHELIS